MSPAQVKAFYAHVWPVFWPVLWWNLIVYRAWRAELRERGFDGNVCIAVARWGQLVVTYVEPPRPDLPDYQGLTERCAAHIARLSMGLTSTERLSGDAEPGWESLVDPRFGLAPFAMGRAQGCVPGAVIHPVPFLDSS